MTRPTTQSHLRVSVWIAGAVLAVCGVWLHAAAQQRTSGSVQTVRLNPLIAALEQGQLAESGKVWTFIDMEHGPYSIDQLQTRLAEIGSKRKPNGQFERTPVVRIPMYGDESPAWAVKQVLDSGGLAIVFPQIDTREQALRAIRSMRYPPQRGAKYPEPRGFRGYAPGRAVKFWGLDEGEYLRRADLWPLNPEGELFAMIMVETLEAVRNIDEILSVPGIGAIFIGPSDLGMNIGIGPPRGRLDSLPPELDAAVQKVAKACAARRVVCGIAANWATEAGHRRLVDQGFRLFL